MYTIKQAAERVGVSAGGLRTWERRYGVGASRRTEAGYRIYDENSLRTLILMHRLVKEGWSVRAAAEEAGRAAPPAPPLDDVDERADDLVAIAASLDVRALTAVLDRQFGAASFETVVDGWLLPALADLGRAWESGSVTVAGEHMVAHGVTRRLSAAYDAADDTRGAPHIVIGLPPGARHDLGLLAFATAARRAGLSTTYLGADVPIADWASATHNAACAVLSAPMSDDTAALAAIAAALKDRLPSLLVAVGGSRQDDTPDYCLRLGHQIGPAASLLARTLSNTDRSAAATGKAPT